MGTLERRDIEVALRAKGFTEDANKDHRYFKLCVGGRYTGISTKTSHGAQKYKSLSAGLISTMARQVKLSSQEFERLVECTLSGEAYIALLVERGERL